MSGRGAQVINARLTPIERSEAARDAAKARWAKTGKKARLAVGQKLQVAQAAARARKAQDGVAA
jgi:hypothetical protein